MEAKPGGEGVEALDAAGCRAGHGTDGRQRGEPGSERDWRRVWCWAWDRRWQGTRSDHGKWFAIFFSASCVREDVVAHGVVSRVQITLVDGVLRKRVQ